MDLALGYLSDTVFYVSCLGYVFHATNDHITHILQALSFSEHYMICSFYM